MLCADLIDVHWKDKTGQNRSALANLEDISVSGACLQMDMPVPRETRLRIAHPKTELEGRVRYCVFRETGYFLGVQFEPGFRWTQRRFALRVEPGRTQPILLAHYTPEGRAVDLAVEADGRPVLSRALAPGQSVPLRLFGGADGARDFRFTVSRAFVPRRLGVSGDRRELGLIAVFPGR